MSEEGLIRIKGWARDGLADKEIIHNMGIKKSAFYNWKKRFPQFAEALKEGKDVPDRKVENALYKKALEGDTTAIVFWLKCRKPDQWRERKDISLEGQVPVVLVDDVIR